MVQALTIAPNGVPTDASTLRSSGADPCPSLAFFGGTYGAIKECEKPGAVARIPPRTLYRNVLILAE